MRGMLALVVLAIAGCAAHKPEPTPEPQIIRVQVPVLVPCKITPVQKPAFAVDALPLGSAIDVQMRALRAERQQRKGYEERLEAAVMACQ